MPSVFQLSGPIGATESYGQRFIRHYEPSQFQFSGPSLLGTGGIGMNFGTALLVGISAAAGALGHRWWSKHKRRR